jgi:inner membrane protein
MDTFTHILTGMAVGQIFSSGTNDRSKPLILGAIAGNLPDLDVIFQPFISPENAMFFHRGISHSILLWVLCSPLLALLMNKICKGDRRSYYKWLKISVIAWFSHIFLDIFNTYGTGIFEPFSHARIAYDVVNVIDFLYLTPIFIISILYVFIIKNRLKKCIIAIVVPTYSLIYIMFAIHTKTDNDTWAYTLFRLEGIEPNRIISSPLPLSMLAWKIIAETDTDFHVGILYGNRTGNVPITRIPKNKCLEKKFEKYDSFQKLKRFTENYYVVSIIDGQTVLCDLRFSSLSPENSALCFPLHIRDNKLEIGRASPNRHITLKNIKHYYKQIVEPNS